LQGIDYLCLSTVQHAQSLHGAPLPTTMASTYVQKTAGAGQALALSISINSGRVSPPTSQVLSEAVLEAEARGEGDLDPEA